MRLFIIGFATCFGCLAGLGTGAVVKLCPPNSPLVTPLLALGGICAVLWVVSMISPMVPPLYKLLGSTALPLIGAVAFGIVGFGAGFALAAVLQLVADFRRFVIMERAATMGFNVPGVMSVESIIAREATSLVVAAVGVGVLLKSGMGVEWLSPGSGQFGGWVPRESATGSLLGLTLLGGILGGARQCIESLVAYLTASGLG